MNIITSLQTVFPAVDDNVDVSEKYSTFDLAYNATWPNASTLADVQACLKQIPATDAWSLTAVVEDEATAISSSGDLSKDSAVLTQSGATLIGSGEFLLKLAVQKGKSDGRVNIYSFSDFEKFVSTIGPLAFLEAVKSEATTFDALRFELLAEVELNFSSCKFVFEPSSKPLASATACRHVTPDKSCDFNRKHDLPFFPDDFRLTTRSDEPTETERMLDSLFSLFLVASIFDSVALRDDRVFIRLIGFRVFDWERAQKEFQIASAETYWRIYEWIYAEPTKVTDKLGLARNVLSTYLKTDSLEIDESAFQAVVSGYKVYLKENLSKYLDLRGKIHDELSEISGKASDLIDGYLSDYQKSVLTFVSFFITVFVVRFFTAAKEDGIFNKEATILTFAFLGISLVYLVVSLIILSKEKGRLEKRYVRLKERFNDLLHEQDIKAILNNDQEYNDEIAFVKTRRLWFSLLWVGTIGILAAVVLTMSTYVSWNDILAKLAALRQQ